MDPFDLIDFWPYKAQKYLLAKVTWARTLGRDQGISPALLLIE